MTPRPQLTEAEWGLVIDLLQDERWALPSEIHHTSRRLLRRALQERLVMVDKLLARLEDRVMCANAPAAR
jgi:hypothetical protein